jgi:hypothetical protein
VVAAVAVVAATGATTFASTAVEGLASTTALVVVVSTLDFFAVGGVPVEGGEGDFFAIILYTNNFFLSVLTHNIYYETYSVINNMFISSKTYATD